MVPLASVIALLACAPRPLAPLSRHGAFTILERAAPQSASAGVHLIGPRKLRRRGALPAEASLLKQLESEQQRHRELSDQVQALDTARTCAWHSPEVMRLKKEKLRCKDRMDALRSKLGRVRAESSSSYGWELGHGGHGRVLLGRRHPDLSSTSSGSGHGLSSEHVAIKLVPSREEAPSSELRREAEVLSLMTSRHELGFPRLLHCGTQRVLGDRSLVLS